MILKTHSGIDALDEAMGGVYAKRSFLVSGRKGSGKTVAGIHFLHQGLEHEERCLSLSTMAANDLMIFSDSLGIPLESHTEQGDLILLEYASFTPGSQTPGKDMLPPEGFDQLRTIIDAHSIKRVLLDTVIPWVAVEDPKRMQEQVFSFVRSFERLGVTTLMTLPQPVSPLAYKLKNVLEEVVPVSILLKIKGEPPSETHSIDIIKYLGAQHLVDGLPWAAGYLQPPIPPTQEPEKAAPKPSGFPPRSRVGFSHVRSTTSAPSSMPTPTPPPPDPKPEGPAKLSSVWRPAEEESPPPPSQS